jgi:hypothetical protein
MKLSLTALVLPVAGGIASALWLPLDKWDSLRPALLPAISVIAAAVLVRLARGLPFTNADHFSLDQFRSVARKLEANARKLRALIFVCLAGLTSLTLATDLVNALRLLPRLADWAVVGASHFLSGLVAALLVYAFTRVIEVVHSDVSLLQLQARILETVIANKNAANFEKQVASKPSPGISGSTRFGGQIAH